MDKMTPSGGVNTTQIEGLESKVKMNLIPEATMSAMQESHDITPKMVKNAYRTLILPMIFHIIIIFTSLVVILFNDTGMLTTILMISSALSFSASLVVLIIISWGTLTHMTSSIQTMLSLSYIDKHVISQLVEMSKELDVDVNDLETAAEEAFDGYLNMINSIIKDPTEYNSDKSKEEDQSFHDHLEDIQSLLILRQMQSEYRKDETGTGLAVEKLIDQGFSDDDIRDHLYMNKGMDVPGEVIMSIRALMVRVEVLNDIFSMWSNKEDIVSLKYEPTEENGNEQNT